MIESVERMLSERTGEAHPEPEPVDPAVQEAIAEMMKRRWEAWFDESIPALEGLTPRQAARSEEGRELLEALLAFYDQSNQRNPDSPTHANTAELRRELGLDGPGRLPRDEY